MPELSEIEALMYLTHQNRDKFIADQLRLKLRVKRELRNPEVDPIKEQQLRDALKMISHNIQRMRVEGFVSDNGSGYIQKAAPGPKPTHYSDDVVWSDEKRHWVLPENMEGDFDDTLKEEITVGDVKDYSDAVDRAFNPKTAPTYTNAREYQVVEDYIDGHFSFINYNLRNGTVENLDDEGKGRIKAMEDLMAPLGSNQLLFRASDGLDTLEGEVSVGNTVVLDGFSSTSRKLEAPFEWIDDSVMASDMVMIEFRASPEIRAMTLSNDDVYEYDQDETILGMGQAGKIREVSAIETPGGGYAKYVVVDLDEPDSSKYANKDSQESSQGDDMVRDLFNSDDVKSLSDIDIDDLYDRTWNQRKKTYYEEDGILVRCEAGSGVLDVLEVYKHPDGSNGDIGEVLGHIEDAARDNRHMEDLYVRKVDDPFLMNTLLKRGYKPHRRKPMPFPAWEKRWMRDVKSMFGMRAEDVYEMTGGISPSANFYKNVKS